MSRGQTLRALVNERLAAAAEEIFVLFERTIAEYEEELCRCKEEKHRNKKLQVLSPRIELVRENVQIPSKSPGPSLNQENTETPWFKEEPEEQSFEQEEEQLPVSVPESSAVYVKTEEFSLLQQRQTKHREETQADDISSDPHFHSETEGHTEHLFDPDNDQWESFSCTAARSMGLFPKYQSAPETTVHSGHMSAADGKKFQCTVCNKRFRAKRNLTIHIRVHTGEKPFGCLICQKTFAQKCNLDLHVRSHTGERPYSCTVCHKAFSQRAHLKAHMNVHGRQRL